MLNPQHLPADFSRNSYQTHLPVMIKLCSGPSSLVQVCLIREGAELCWRGDLQTGLSRLVLDALVSLMVSAVPLQDSVSVPLLSVPMVTLVSCHSDSVCLHPLVTWFALCSPVYNRLLSFSISPSVVPAPALLCLLLVLDQLLHMDLLIFSSLPVLQNN